MTRDEIITLAGQLAQSLQNTDTFDTYTNDVFDELAFLPAPHLVIAAIKALTSGTATYNFESDMLRIVYAIMYDELLSPVDEKALDAYAAAWQATSGTPTQYTQDAITARTYRLYPKPNFTSDAYVPVVGEPFGEDFPANSLVLIYADDREDDIPPIYALPIAFETLSREFTYPSDHTDIAFSSMCRNVAQLFNRLLGVE